TARCGGAGQQQFERHRPVDDVGGAYDHRILTLERGADVLEQPDHAEGRAGPHQRNALRETADVVRVETVDVLVRVDPLDHRTPADVRRQGQLHQDAVHALIAIELVDQSQQASF